MDFLKKLNKKELLALKEGIDLQIDFIDNLKVENQVSKGKESLSDLNRGDKIFCIYFNGSKIHGMDYVKIAFCKDNDSKYTSFSTEHDTKPMGCNSSIVSSAMNKHCFLNEFDYSHIFFYTLKPESWKFDLNVEYKRNVMLKKFLFNEDLKKFKSKIKGVISNPEVDDMIAKFI